MTTLSPISPEQITQTVLQIVNETVGKKPGHLKPADPIFSGKAYFDSVALIELVLRLEQSFNLTIPDEDLDPDIFYSVEKIATYIHQRTIKES